MTQFPLPSPFENKVENECMDFKDYSRVAIIYLGNILNCMESVVYVERNKSFVLRKFTGRSASEYHGTAEYQLLYFSSYGLPIPLLDVLCCFFHCTISPPQTYIEKNAIFHCF